MANADRKILCIEDDRETAGLIAEELVDRGFQVSLAYGGQEGLMAIMRATPDLVLCDVSMPNMTGFEVLERLNEIAPRLGRIPFVFLTALTDRDNELKGRQLGADDYVSKPIDFDLLGFIIEARIAGVARTKLVPKITEQAGAPAPAVVARHREAPVAESRVRVGGNADLIIETLQRWPDLDDDELSRRSGITPRQQVNIICRRLEQSGILERFTGTRGKIVNRLAGIHRTAEVRAPRSAAQPVAATRVASSLPFGSTVCLGSAADDTLVVIPCSGRKREGSEPFDEGRTLLDELPDVLARRLASSRAAVADVAHLDESTLMPAWRRNAGMLYQSAHLGLAGAQGAIWFRRLLILSGGYGVVRAIDPIGTYDLAMDAGRWPRGLLQEVIEAYARRHQIRRVIALVSETTGYARILRKVDWRGAGLTDALLLSPEASTGAMVKAPRAIGEALRTIIDNGWDPSWRSSDGLQILVRRMV